MIKIYNDDIYDLIHKLVNDKDFKKCDMIIFNTNNKKYNEDYNEYLRKIEEILSLSSYMIKKGGNIIIIGNHLIDDIDDSLENQFLWSKQRTITYETKPEIILEDPIKYILWYSDSYNPNSPQFVCNEFDDNRELSNSWGESIDMYETIIKMFSNENDTIFDPQMKDETIKEYCEKLDRNYIGIKNDKI